MCFVGNEKAGHELQAWLEKTDFASRLGFQSVLFISGPSGVGKTWGVKKACTDRGMTINMLDTNTVNQYKDFEDILTKLASSDITTQFGFVKKKDVVVCIDELEALAMLDRTFIASLLKLLQSQSLPHIRIIITCQMVEQKKMMEIQKHTTNIQLESPSQEVVFAFLRDLYPDKPERMMRSISMSCFGNLGVALHAVEMRERRKKRVDKEQTPPPAVSKTGKKMIRLRKAAPSILPAKQEVCYGKGGDESWEKEDEKLLREQCAKIDVAVSLETVFKGDDIEKTRRLFMEDPWIHPLRFYENLQNEFKQRKGSSVDKQKVYGKLIAGMCYWDVMISKLNELDHDLAMPSEYVAHLTLHLNDLERKKSLTTNEDFTRLFSQLSLEKKNLHSLYGTYQDVISSITSYHKYILQTKQKRRRTKATTTALDIAE